MNFLSSSLGFTASRYAIFAGIALTLFVGFSSVWNADNLDKQAIYLATEEARGNWNKDQAFRRWATRHGGLYVRPDERTPPNPYLEHIPNRDVETTDGMRLTLMNPAYMMSQMTKEFETMYGVKGKITGQVLLNPKNKADPWEMRALKQFDKGAKEVFEQSNIDGQPYVRLMRPMVMKKGCVLCHGHLGFKVGDIRGGVSISVPLKPYFAAAEKSKTSLLSTHGAVWLIGMLVIVLVAQRAQKREMERRRVGVALEKESSLIRLLYEIAVTANYGSSLEQAVQEIVDEVCRYTGWPIGHIYVIDPDNPNTLISTDVWHIAGDQKDFSTFRAVTETTSFEKGIGLPGRVFESGQPAWIVDVTKDSNFPRMKAAKDIGIRSGFAIPVLAETEVVAVLEFFAVDAVEPDGSLLWSLANICTQIGRVFERAQAEKIVKASDDRLAALFAIAPEAIITTNKDFGVQLFNQAAERIFGYRAEEVIGQPIEILIPEEFRAGHRKHIENFAGSQQSYRMMGDRQDIAGLRKDGSIFPATASVSKLEIKEDTLFTVMLSDISERKASEAHLLQADKLATLGTLAAGTAHELSQPLNIIRLTTDSILFEAEANSSTASIEKKDLEGITAQVLRMAEIIDHMRVFSRKEDTLAELFMPTTVIGEALNLVKKQFAAVDISLERRLPDVCGLVRGSSGQLEQVILNLVTNACDAVEARLQQLAASNEKFHGKIGVELVDDDANDKIIISVTDNGGGIEESALKNIFDPFFTTKEAGKGTGLGLHVSYSIIDAMGGELEAHNGNVGACFTVSLPRAEQPQVNEPKPQQIERADEPVDQHRCSILVVDDEQQASNLLANTLRNRGHEVFTANNGAQALERFQVRPTDVVITDLQMPEMNGTILIDRLRQISPEVPIIVITGQVAAGENKADFEKQPRTFVLTKPIALPELMKALERVTN